ncbi:MAG TPA: serine hydrolase domain-containing protein [Rhizomicrobium sp.]|nr:serine hydrolase domain-containing protein [Rhizomicrobium sp.]
MNIPIGGICDFRFLAVREAFIANFTERGEPGAAVAIAIGGKRVVDLWGGYADVAQTRPWERNTLVNFFSVSKALCAISANILVERGLVTLDAPVARIWPEFGKEQITLRHILSHQSALPAIREDMEDGTMLDWQTMIHALEKQEPWWEPGTAFGYHVNTFGFLVGEIVRRATGMSIGQFVKRTIAAPLDADLYIGLPATEHARVAEFRWPNVIPTPDIPPGDDMALMRWNSYWNPPGFSGAHWINTPAWRIAEVPSTNGHGNARAIARVYSALARWGEIDGVRIIGEEILRNAVIEQSHGIDLITQHSARFGLGFQLTQPERRLGPNPNSFGHFGAGGSLGFCDPDCDLAFGYVTNDMGPRWQNPRNRALIEAVYSSLGSDLK